GRPTSRSPGGAWARRRKTATPTTRPPTRSSRTDCVWRPSAARRGPTTARPSSLDWRNGIPSRHRRGGAGAGAARGAAGGGGAGRGEASGETPGASGAEAKETEEAPDVDVWHWRDSEVMAHQVKNASQNGRRSMLAAWHPDTGGLAQLGHSLTEQVTPIKH